MERISCLLIDAIPSSIRFIFAPDSSSNIHYSSNLHSICVAYITIAATAGGAQLKKKNDVRPNMRPEKCEFHANEVGHKHATQCVNASRIDPVKCAGSGPRNKKSLHSIRVRRIKMYLSSDALSSTHFVFDISTQTSGIYVVMACQLISRVFLESGWQPKTEVMSISF